MSSKSEKQASNQAKTPNRRTGATANEAKIVGRIGESSSPTPRGPEMLQLQQKDKVPDRIADEADQARAAAYLEAESAYAALDQKVAEADKTQWKLAAAILRVGECLLDASHELDPAKLDAFLTKQNVKRHGNNREEWRLIVKACVPPKTEADRITKLGYALTSMFDQGIGSEMALAELENGADIDGTKRFGLNRFVIQYKADRKAKAAATEGRSETPNKYKLMEKDRLLREAGLLLAALKDKAIALPSLKRLEEAIAEAASASPKSRAAT